MREIQMPRLILVTLFLCLALMVESGAAEAQSDVADESAESAESNDEEKSGMLARAGAIVDDTHDRFSDRFSSFIDQIDDFIGTGTGGKNLNNSWVRVRIDTIKPGGEKLKLTGRVKTRLVLPQAQRRFRLLFSTEDDETDATNSDAAQREQIAADDSGNVALALRFIRSAQARFRLNYDVGARFRDDKAQLFGRINFAYRRESAFDITHELSNNLTYFTSTGYENLFRIDSRRLFFNRESLYFRNSFDISWREGISGVGFGDTAGFYADLGKRKALALEAITGYVTSLSEGNTDRFLGTELRVRFRHNVWRPWFFYEVWPSVSWSSSNNFERAFGGLFRLEVTFGQTDR